MIPFTLAPHIEFGKKDKPEPASDTTMGANDLQFTLMAVALIFMACAVVALSGVVLVHAVKA